MVKLFLSYFICNTLNLYFYLSHSLLSLSLAEDDIGLDVDALDEEEGIVVESGGSGGDHAVEVDVVGQCGTFLLFLPFNGAFPVHDRGIVGGANGGSQMAIGFTFGVSE